MGEALDSLTNQLSLAGPTLVFIQKQQADQFFSQEQQDRMRELMARQESLLPAEYEELETLIDAELDATVARTESLVRQLVP